MYRSKNKFKNIDEVIEYCKSIDTNDREGVVIQDKLRKATRFDIPHIRTHVTAGNNVTRRTITIHIGDQHFGASGTLRKCQSHRQWAVEVAKKAQSQGVFKIKQRS